LLSVASAVLGRDLLKESPRTLEAMGLTRLNRTEMTQLLDQGA